ncbi:hypothetical protein ACFX10_009890 [Malus domestica]
MLGAKIGSVLEIENPIALRFQGFLWIRVDFDDTKPLLTSFVMSCPSNGSRTLQLWYEGLEDFFYNCGSSVTFGTASGKLPSAGMVRIAIIRT